MSIKNKIENIFYYTKKKELAYGIINMTCSVAEIEDCFLRYYIKNGDFSKENIDNAISQFCNDKSLQEISGMYFKSKEYYEPIEQQMELMEKERNNWKQERTETIEKLLNDLNKNDEFAECKLKGYGTNKKYDVAISKDDSNNFEISINNTAFLKCTDKELNQTMDKDTIFWDYGNDMDLIEAVEDIKNALLEKEYVIDFKSKDIEIEQDEEEIEF